MENTKKVRKIAISDDIQQKALILAAKYKFQDIADKKVDIDELLSKIIESSINYLYQEKYVRELDEEQNGQEIRFRGNIFVSIDRTEKDKPSIEIHQQSKKGVTPLYTGPIQITQENPEIGMHIEFKTDDFLKNE